MMIPVKKQMTTTKTQKHQRDLNSFFLLLLVRSAADSSNVSSVRRRRRRPRGRGCSARQSITPSVRPPSSLPDLIVPPPRREAAQIGLFSGGGGGSVRAVYVTLRPRRGGRRCCLSPLPSLNALSHELPAAAASAFRLAGLPARREAEAEGQVTD